MKTYTVTIKFNQYSDTYTNQTAKQVKAYKAQVAADGEGWSITVVEGTPIRKCFYRGEEVTRVEDRQLGWTLVYSGSTSNGNYKQFFARTAELEYK